MGGISSLLFIHCCLKLSLILIYTLNLMRFSNFPRPSPLRSIFKAVRPTISRFESPRGTVKYHSVKQVEDSENPIPQGFSPNDFTKVVEYANDLAPKKRKEILNLGLQIQLGQMSEGILRKM